MTYHSEEAGEQAVETGHPFWRFAENRYCALNISPIFIKFSPNVRQCMQNMVKL
jgi:hypothetical protein